MGICSEWKGVDEELDYIPYGLKEQWLSDRIDRKTNEQGYKQIYERERDGKKNGEIRYTYHSIPYENAKSKKSLIK